MGSKNIGVHCQWITCKIKADIASNDIGLQHSHKRIIKQVTHVCISRIHVYIVPFVRICPPEPINGVIWIPAHHEIRLGIDMSKNKRITDLRIGGSSDRVPKSPRNTALIAWLVLSIMATDIIVDLRGRNSREFMKGVSLLSDAADRHTDTKELCARMYISSNHGYVWGIPITISTPS